MRQTRRVCKKSGGLRAKNQGHRGRIRCDNLYGRGRYLQSGGETRKMIRNYPLKKFTAMRVGGPAKYFTVVKSEKDLIEALSFAKKNRLKWYVLGEGSNMIVSDKGYKGLIIQNRIQKFELTPTLSLKKRGSSIKFITAGAGNNLLEFIERLNRLSLSGLERMAGIPGTVGGAIYGCAGAYGQEIKDHLVAVKVFDGSRVRSLTSAECRFGYRTSIFKKHKDWIILEATFKLDHNDRGVLQEISQDIVKKRAIKYPPGLRCPGSFFKNIKLSDLPAPERQSLLRKIPKERVTYGKVATGYLLQQSGAKGLREGRVAVAGHHGNLIYNPGGGTARDVKKLAERLRKLVKNKFHVTIEEEVQYLGF